MESKVVRAACPGCGANLESAIVDVGRVVCSYCGSVVLKQFAELPSFANHLLLGQEYLQTFNYREAAVQFSKALEMNPTSSEAWFWVSVAAALAGDLTKATSLWGKSKFSVQDSESCLISLWREQVADSFSLLHFASSNCRGIWRRVLVGVAIALITDWQDRNIAKSLRMTIREILYDTRDFEWAISIAVRCMTANRPNRPLALQILLDLVTEARGIQRIDLAEFLQQQADIVLSESDSLSQLEGYDQSQIIDALLDRAISFVNKGELVNAEQHIHKAMMLWQRGITPGTSVMLARRLAQLNRLNEAEQVLQRLESDPANSVRLLALDARKEMAYLFAQKGRAK